MYTYSQKGDGASNSFNIKNCDMLFLTYSLTFWNFTVSHKEKFKTFRPSIKPSHREGIFKKDSETTNSFFYLRTIFVSFLTWKFALSFYKKVQYQYQVRYVCVLFLSCTYLVTRFITSFFLEELDGAALFWVEFTFGVGINCDRSRTYLFKTIFPCSTDFFQSDKGLSSTVESKGNVWWCTNWRDTLTFFYFSCNEFQLIILVATNYMPKLGIQ